LGTIFLDSLPADATIAAVQNNIVRGFSMNKALVVVVGLFSAIGCGPAPVETAYQVKTYGLFCDRMHECLASAEAKALPFSFFLGQNPAECKAAYNESDADASTRGEYGVRNFVQAEADKCTDAVAKLSCSDVKQLAYAQINTSPAAAGSDTAKAIQTQARTILSVSDTFSCLVDGQCNASAPICNLGTVNGACAAYRIKPYKDANNAKAEADGYTAPMSTAGCGTLPIEI